MKAKHTLRLVPANTEHMIAVYRGRGPEQEESMTALVYILRRFSREERITVQGLR